VTVARDGRATALSFDDGGEVLQRSLYVQV
jgi:hypothetical protein